MNTCYFTSFPIGKIVLLRNKSCLVKNKWLKVLSLSVAVMGSKLGSFITITSLTTCSENSTSTELPTGPLKKSLLERLLAFSLSSYVTSIF